MPKDYNFTHSIPTMVGSRMGYFDFLTTVARHEFQRAGFQHIAIPIIEGSRFTNPLNQDTEALLHKNTSISILTNNIETVFKKETTAAIIKAHVAQPQSKLQYLWYMEPYFRAIKDGLLQLHRVGAEVLGESNSIIDARLIQIGCSLLEDAGLGGKYTLKINNIGTPKEHLKYADELTSFFENKKHLLNQEDLALLKENPLRILNSTNPSVMDLLPFMPKITDFLAGDSLESYVKIKNYLSLSGVCYEEDHLFIMDANHYSDTIWKWVENSNQGVLGQGGRYDLSNDSEGTLSKIHGAGFSIEIEKVINSMIKHQIQVKGTQKPHLCFVHIGDRAKELVFPLEVEARHAGLTTFVCLGSSNMAKQMQEAIHTGAEYAVIIGVVEAAQGICNLKELSTGKQVQIPISELINEVLARVDEYSLDYYTPSEEYFLA